MSGDRDCKLCGGTGEVRVDGCTCAAVDIGVGILHEPGCGLDMCECWHRDDHEPGASPEDDEGWKP